MHAFLLFNMRVSVYLAFLVSMISMVHAVSQVATSRPPVFIIGAMKGLSSCLIAPHTSAGTTALWGILQNHPNVRPAMIMMGESDSHKKEIFFFSLKSMYLKGIEHYQRRLSAQKNPSTFV